MKLNNATLFLVRTGVVVVFVVIAVVVVAAPVSGFDNVVVATANVVAAIDIVVAFIGKTKKCNSKHLIGNFFNLWICNTKT